LYIASFHLEWECEIRPSSVKSVFIKYLLCHLSCLYYFLCLYFNTCRITAVLKDETDIINSITRRLTGRAVIIVIMYMYVKTFKTLDVIIFIDIKHRNIRLNWPIFTSIRVSLLMLTISLTEIKEKMSNTSIQINIYVHKKILLRPWSYGLFVCLMVFNATFNIISVLLVEETRGPGENHRPVASHWQTLSLNVVHLSLIEIRTHNIGGDRHWLHK
jgi:hypothetical protein